MDNRTKFLRIAVVEPAPIVRLGVMAILKKLTSYRIQFSEAGDQVGDVAQFLTAHPTDLLIINPLIGGMTLDERLRQIPVIALITSSIPPSVPVGYDGSINTYDDANQCKAVIDKLLSVDSPSPTNTDQQSLTAREKEIVICVVKGMTNREIARSLFLSTHTVITHRRNIAKKLQIHSPSGLTIYAIVNKLVNLEDIAK